MSFFKKIFKPSKSEPAFPETDDGPPARKVALTTNIGIITIDLYPEKAPKTCRNFAALCDAGKYDNCPFHRLIHDFMIQGGDYTRQDGTGGKSIWGKKFEDEIDASLSHDKRGILSMANSGPNTNGSQFFITLGPCTHLDGKHTIFGQVVGGWDVLDQFARSTTGELDRPNDYLKIETTKTFT